MSYSGTTTVGQWFDEPTAQTPVLYGSMMEVGKKYDSGKLRMDLIDPTALEGMAAVLTFGANKYGDRNWEKGIKWSRVFGALLRHAWAMWKGEDFDPETNLPHIDHVAVNVMFLQRFFRTHRMGWDDRPNNPLNSVVPPVQGTLVESKVAWLNSSTPALYVEPAGEVQCDPIPTPEANQVWCSECNTYHTNY